MTTNPFVFGTIVSDENFAGRKNEINELARDLTGKTKLIIFSPRRYGKTSLIFKVMEENQARLSVRSESSIDDTTSDFRYKDSDLRKNKTNQ